MVKAAPSARNQAAGVSRLRTTALILSVIEAKVCPGARIVGLAGPRLTSSMRSSCSAITSARLFPGVRRPATQDWDWSPPPYIACVVACSDRPATRSFVDEHAAWLYGFADHSDFQRRLRQPGRPARTQW